MKKKEKDSKKPSSKMKGKMAALKGLHKMASDMMGDDMKSMKKVSVVAKDKKGLKKGLEKAEELLGDDDSSEC
jgi:hypothetical protein